MLELPESYHIAEQITAYLKGKKICGIETGHTPHRFAFFKGDQMHYEEMMRGQRIEGATNQGGLVEIDTTDQMLFFGDGALPRYWEKGETLPQKRQLLITFEDGSFLTSSIQMYGEIGVFPLGQCDDAYYLSSSTKISPLSEQFTEDYFKHLYQPDHKKMTVKAFLATEQRIPGLGNGILQDILWEAGLDPRYDMKELSEEAFHRLYGCVQSVIRKMCLAGGRNTEKDLFGNRGSYITQLCKLTLEKPCPKCGEPIQKANYMGGTVYFCSHCQRK